MRRGGRPTPVSRLFVKNVNQSLFVIISCLVFALNQTGSPYSDVSDRPGLPIRIILCENSEYKPELQLSAQLPSVSLCAGAPCWFLSFSSWGELPVCGPALHQQLHGSLQALARLRPLCCGTICSPTQTLLSHHSDDAPCNTDHKQNGGHDREGDPGKSKPKSQLKVPSAGVWFASRWHLLCLCRSRRPSLVRSPSGWQTPQSCSTSSDTTETWAPPLSKVSWICPTSCTTRTSTYCGSFHRVPSVGTNWDFYIKIWCKYRYKIYSKRSAKEVWKCWNCFSTWLSSSALSGWTSTSAQSNVERKVFLCVLSPSLLLQCLQNELRTHLPTFLIDPEQYGPLPVGIGKLI